MPFLPATKQGISCVGQVSTLLASSPPMSVIGVIYPQAHLLGLPFESRLEIYSLVLQNIQEEPRDWQRNPSSSYDGLHFTCRQLYEETSECIFYSRITRFQISQIRCLPTARSTFLRMRTLYLELDHNLDDSGLYGVAKTLSCFQLSLQELYLFFIGSDKHGIRTNANGCAYKVTHPKYTNESQLLTTGQDVERKLELLRQLILLRHLRILKIENANLPLLPKMLVINKPALTALSVTCDPRSRADTFNRLPKMCRILKGLLAKLESQQMPPLEALHIDANAVVPAEDVVKCLAPTLRHLTWRVPDFNHQGRNTTLRSTFCHMTDGLFQTLHWRSPNLETLRLCVKMTNALSDTNKYRHDIETIVAGLKYDLYKFPSLKRFELHLNGTDYFFRHEFINSLPYSMQRLYITDKTISVDELVEQVRQRYFVHANVDNGSCGIGKVDRGLPHLELRAEVAWIAVSELARVKYTWQTQFDVVPLPKSKGILVKRDLVCKEDYLDDHHLLGERKGRQDTIPLNTGKLGFVTFEYGDTDRHSYGGSDGSIESACTKLLRLNGQLLDREHNLHLAPTEGYSTTTYGIQPHQKRPVGELKVESDTLGEETDQHSSYFEIRLALYDMQQQAFKPDLVEERLQELRPCLGLEDDWYFGNENEAMEVFMQEPVARADAQRQKTIAIDVKAACSDRCRWMSPEFDVPPVGSFPTPIVPCDWRE